MSGIKDLLDVMNRLRDPDKGCPWDREQTYETIVPYTLEEAYEVADAIARQDWSDLKAELGDLLFQVVFYAQIAKEEGRFDFHHVVESITEKMINRHPHVFGSAQVSTAEEQTELWDKHKQRERSLRKDGVENSSILAHITRGLPALSRARKMQSRAAKIGFDWDNLEDVFAKFEEELRELSVGINNQDQNNIKEEMGDLLFMCVNLARHLGVDPETALHESNQKFKRRISHMENAASDKSTSLHKLSLSELESLWENSKK